MNHTNCTNCGQFIYNEDDNPFRFKEFCCFRCEEEWEAENARRRQEYVDSGQAAIDEEEARVRAAIAKEESKIQEAQAKANLIWQKRKKRLLGILRILYFLPPYLIFSWFWSRLYPTYYQIPLWQSSTWLMFFVGTCAVLVFPYRAVDRGDSGSGYFGQWLEDLFGCLLFGSVPLCMIGMRLNWNLVLNVVIGLAVMLLLPMRWIKELVATIVFASFASLAVLFVSKWLGRIADQIF